MQRYSPWPGEHKQRALNEIRVPKGPQQSSASLTIYTRDRPPCCSGPPQNQLAFIRPGSGPAGCFLWQGKVNPATEASGYHKTHAITKHANAHTRTQAHIQRQETGPGKSPFVSRTQTTSKILTLSPRLVSKNIDTISHLSTAPFALSACLSISSTSIKKSRSIPPLSALTV